MKNIKRIMIMIFSLAVLPTHAQIDSLLKKMTPNVNISIQADSIMNQIKGVVPDSVLPFYREVYGDLKAGAHSIASGLGVAAKELFEVLVIQQYVKSITNIIFFIFALLFLFMCYRMGSKVNWHGQDEVSGRALGTVVLAIVCLFFMVWTFIHVDETVMGIVNPKFGAIQDIVEMASEIKNGK